MKMIHWDTLQDCENECQSDNGGTQMVREDDAVFLHVRSDLLAGPDLLAACKYPRFGDTAALLDKAADALDVEAKAEGPNVQSLLSGHLRRAAKNIRKALVKAKGEEANRETPKPAPQ